MRFGCKVIQGWISEISGEVLITKSKISFLGDIDLKTGKIIASDIDVRGKEISQKILIFLEGRGSTVGSNILFDLTNRGLAPKLIATYKADLVTVSGAVFGGIPMVSNIDEKVFDCIKNGDWVRAYLVNKEAYLEKAE